MPGLRPDEGVRARGGSGKPNRLSRTSQRGPVPHHVTSQKGWEIMTSAEYMLWDTLESIKYFFWGINLGLFVGTIHIYFKISGMKK
ncbi:hypothetical protein Desgi_4282 [Desulfoscipio gibsoniae DSM 7213]|uniref:Uncharacterized protein n=1 Tax=Desulfoscipio gibsoniae DSM 7213 TaxID=767817 RepID=R4KVA4_9FIRM|nr:hypothetical protein Desgi_4282 [Desulfoscipio gibsoniae DSM 7213]